MHKYKLLLQIWPDFSYIRNPKVNGTTYWVGCDVVWALGHVNTTNAIRGSWKYPKLTEPEFRMFKITEINHRKKVYLLTMEGVIQVIKKNRSKKCRGLQKFLKEAGL